MKTLHELLLAELSRYRTRQEVVLQEVGLVLPQVANASLLRFVIKSVRDRRFERFLR